MPLGGSTDLTNCACDGCGETIETSNDLYRCAECHAPFHHACILTHFERSVQVTHLAPGLCRIGQA